MIKIGSKVRIKTPSSDFHNLVGIVVKDYPSPRPEDVRFDVTFSQVELQKANLKNKKNTIYFIVTELEDVSAKNQN